MAGSGLNMPVKMRKMTSGWLKHLSCTTSQIKFNLLKTWRFYFSQPLAIFTLVMLWNYEICVHFTLHRWSSLIMVQNGSKHVADWLPTIWTFSLQRRIYTVLIFFVMNEKYGVIRHGFSYPLRLFLPWLRFFRAFSSLVRQMPGQNSQRRCSARTLPN